MTRLFVLLTGGLMCAGCGVREQDTQRQDNGAATNVQLVLAVSGGIGDVEIHLPRPGRETPYPIPAPIMVEAFAGDGRGVVGRNGSFEVVAVGIDGRPGLIAHIEGHSGNSRVAVTNDLTRVAVCDRFQVDGRIARGIVIAGMDGSRDLIHDVSASSDRCGQLSWNSATGELAAGVSPEIAIIDSAKLKVIRRFSGSLPAWAPDGGRIAFRNPAGLLCVAGADLTGTKCYEEKVEGFIAWSPDGVYVAFERPDGFLFTRSSLFTVSDGSVRDVWGVTTGFKTPVVGWLSLRTEDVRDLLR